MLLLLMHCLCMLKERALSDRAFVSKIDIVELE